MNLDTLPFKIGMEYENWEFELDVIEDKLIGRDSYLYIGNEVTELYGFKIERIELIFYWDILEVVCITILCNSTELEKTIQSENYRLWIKSVEDNTVIILVSPDTFSNDITSLLW